MSLQRLKDAVAELFGVRYAEQHDEGFNQLKVAMDQIQMLEHSVDDAYTERNKLVALLTSHYPSGRKRTAIEDWDSCWHNCVYIDFPWGQASWHYHDDHAWMFSHLPEYKGEWDGHTTTEKYDAIMRAAKRLGARRRRR